MLRELTIENVAVIEKATVSFDKGFNVLTGETGAGKSILIDSINAILGNRISRDIIRTGADKASIWAVFDNISNDAAVCLQQAGYPAEDELLLSRDITMDGKSVCRINGRTATAALLRQVCETLINIHGQHDNQNLLNSAKHLSMLDAFADDEQFLNEYRAQFRILVSLEKQIKNLSMDETEKEKKLELLKFQVNEIDASKLAQGEEEKLNQEKNIILHSQKIVDALNSAYTCMENEDGGAVTLLANASALLQGVQSYAENLAPISEKINELYYTSQELVLDIKNELDSYEFEPDRLEQIEERLDEIYHLKQKYGQNIEEILKYGQNAKNEIETIEFSDEKLDKLLEQRDDLYEKVKQMAAKLTAIRLSAFDKLQQQLEKSLEFLNMPGIKFSLKHQTGTMTINGWDTLEFYIITNAGETPKPLAKIASGGELSRIMLAIKSALAAVDDIDTVIYDEIDTGISGLAAGRIGKTLKQTSMGRQVICVTHTAQIAACADRHMLIKKNVENGRTYTNINPLSMQQRAAEIARIISGDNITELALAGANEMLAMANK